MTYTKSRSIFLCIFRNFLCISKNGWPHHKFASKLLKFLLVAFDLYTQPWTKLQNEIQHFLFFRTGYGATQRMSHSTVKECNSYKKILLSLYHTGLEPARMWPMP